LAIAVCCYRYINRLRSSGQSERTAPDSLALDSFAMGANGWVVGVGLAFSRENVAIWRLYKAGRFGETRAIYRWMKPMPDIDASAGLVQNIKLAEKIANSAGWPRIKASRLKRSFNDNKTS
jgi:4-hydroxy-tetrahydrodipicolinate synthase